MDSAESEIEDMPGDGSTYRPPPACPLCAGELREVQISTRSEAVTVKVHLPSRMFARKSDVEALACRSCGHLLLFMAHPEIMDEPPPRARRKR
ncbi:hypothetical protein [Kitasatospora nipponensis]